MEVGHILLAEIINYLLNHLQLLVQNIFLEKACGQGLDGGEDSFILLADQGLHFLELQHNFGKISCVSLHISVVFVPNSSESFLNAHHDSFLFLCNQFKHFLVNFGADLVIGSDGLLQGDDEWIKVD